MNNNQEEANLAKIIAGNGKSQWYKKFEENRIHEDELDRSVDIALAIADRIEELGMSQKTLADLMNKSAQYINKVLKGRQNLTINSIGAFEKVLETKLIEVVTNRNEENENESFVCTMAQVSYDSFQSKFYEEYLKEDYQKVSEVQEYAMAA